jgi:hypothetical protein
MVEASMQWTDRARDALAALVARDHLDADARRRVEQLAEQDALGGAVEAINVGAAAVAAGYEDPAAIGLGDDGWPAAR